MTYALTVAVAVLGLLVLIIFATLREILEQIHQLRVAESVNDSMMEVEFDSGASLERLDLTAVELQGRFAIVQLSTSCSTCAHVVSALPAKRTPNVLVVVNGPNESNILRWCNEAGLALDGFRVIGDHRRTVASRIGVSVTPSATLFEHGLPVKAVTLPTPRRLTSIFDWVHGVGDMTTGESRSHIATS